MWFLGLLLNLRQALRTSDTPRQLAWGFALGVWLGLTPKDNLFAAALGVFVLATNVNLGIAMFTAFFVSIFAGFADSTALWIGRSLLLFAPLESIWRRLEAWELFRVWSHFNRPAVLGGFVLGGMSAYPLHRISRPLFANYWPRKRETTAAASANANVDDEPTDVAVEREKVEQQTPAAPAAAELTSAESNEGSPAEAELAEHNPDTNLEAAKLEAAKLEAAKRAETERLEAERIEAERVEAERIEAERIKAERIEAERIEAERVEAERAEAERIKAERAEAERVEAARIEAERIEAERIEAERIEAERVEERRAEEMRAAELARVAEEARLAAEKRANDLALQAIRKQMRQAGSLTAAPFAKPSTDASDAVASSEAAGLETPSVEETATPTPSSLNETADSANPDGVAHADPPVQVATRLGSHRDGSWRAQGDDGQSQQNGAELARAQEAERLDRLPEYSPPTLPEATVEESEVAVEGASNIDAAPISAASEALNAETNGRGELTEDESQQPELLAGSASEDAAAKVAAHTMAEGEDELAGVSGASSVGESEGPESFARESSAGLASTAESVVSDNESVGVAGEPVAALTGAELEDEAVDQTVDEAADQTTGQPGQATEDSALPEPVAEAGKPRYRRLVVPSFRIRRRRDSAA